MIWAPFNAEFHAFANRTDYAVCEGDTFVGGDEGPPTLEVGDDPNYRWTDTSRATGICFLRSRVALAEVRDGLGNTYLAGEKYRTLDDNEDPGYDQSLFSGVDLDINRWTYEPPTPDATDLHHVRFRGATRFGSSHPAAVNYVFCDGSVRSASFDIDPEVHRRLGTRAEMAFADPSALQ
jgi:prepilin-type processing-associated H-X9-DG protein